MRVAYTAEALGDVRQVLSFVADQSPSHAPDVAARIDMAVKAVGVFPRAARFDRETSTYERLIPGLPLLLIYTVSDELVEVIGVFHTARDPAAKRRRDSEH
jgi:toxin ParE1/3/4